MSPQAALGANSLSEGPHEVCREPPMSRRAAPKANSGVRSTEDAQ